MFSTLLLPFVWQPGKSSERVNHRVAFQRTLQRSSSVVDLKSSQPYGRTFVPEKQQWITHLPFSIIFTKPPIASLIREQLILQFLSIVNDVKHSLKYVWFYFWFNSLRWLIIDNVFTCLYCGPTGTGIIYFNNIVVKWNAQIAKPPVSSTLWWPLLFFFLIFFFMF